MAIEPCGHRVLVKPDPVEEQTKGGIILAATTVEKEKRSAVYGTILKIGPNAWKAFDGGEPWADVGDRVVYAQYGGMVVKDEGGEECRLLNDEDIVAVIKEG